MTKVELIQHHIQYLQNNFWSKEVINKCPEVREKHEEMKQFIREKLEGFKRVNPEQDFILIGSCGLIMIDELYAPFISDIDIYCKSNIKLIQKTSMIDVLNAPFLHNGYEGRLIDVVGIKCLSKADSLIHMSASLHKIGKMSKKNKLYIELLSAYDCNTKRVIEMTRETLEEYKKRSVYEPERENTLIKDVKEFEFILMNKREILERRNYEMDALAYEEVFADVK